MKQTLQKILKVVNFLWRILPVLIDSIQDLADDGIINDSTKNNNKSRKANKPTS